MRDTLVARLSARMQFDDRILILTGDLGFGVFDKVIEAYPGRLINAGVSEQNMMSMAAGLALEGYTPFVYSIANFPTLRALQQLRNDVCYHGLSVRVVSIGGGLGYGALGPSHHASDDLGALLAIPDLAVFTPATSGEVVSLTDAAVDWNGPVHIRIDRGSPVAAAGENIGIPGRVNRLRAGRDATLFGYGNIIGEALSAASELSDEGIEIAVVSCVSLKPFDADAFLQAASAGPVITVEEHGRVGGLATTFAQTCIEAGVTPVAFRGLSLGDHFVREVGSTNWLRTVKGLDSDAIVVAVRRLLKRMDGVE